MMIALCTPDGDFDFSPNGMALTALDANGNDMQEIVQLIRNYLRWIQGEEPTDITGGVPYFQQIFNKSTPVEISVAILRAQIENVPGVKGVLDLTFTLTQRQITIFFTANTNAGPVTSTAVLMGLTPAQEAAQ